MKTKKGLSAYTLQFIAAIAMFIDHLARVVVNLHFSFNTELVIAMNCIGRITMPVMCYFVAEGYNKTSNLKNYMLRLFVFAIISQMPYYIFRIDAMPQGFREFVGSNLYHINVIYTLFMGLAALAAVKSDKFNIVVKTAVVIAAVYLTRFSDWRYFGVIWILIFGIFRDSFAKQAIFFVVAALARCFINNYDMLSMGIQMCVVLALPLLYLYNGQKGHKPKYGFYVLYPLHLLVLGVIRFIIIT